MSSTIASRGLHGVARGFAALIACAGCAAAADGERFWDLMADIESVQAPKVTENSSDASGVNTTYKWKGGHDTGIAGRATLLTGTSTARKPYGFEWGADLFASRYTITPTAFDVGGARFANNSSNDQRYYTAGIDVAAGWQYGVVNRDDVHGFVEVVPFLGGGFCHASSDITFGGGVNHPASGYGSYVQYGVRVGGYLTERRWLVGALLVYQGSYGSVSLDGGQGFSSDLTLKQQSFGFGGVVGYRF